MQESLKVTTDCPLKSLSELWGRYKLQMEPELSAARCIAAKQSTRWQQRCSIPLSNPQALQFGSSPAFICTIVKSSGKSTEVLQLLVCIDFVHTLARTQLRDGAYLES